MRNVNSLFISLSCVALPVLLTACASQPAPAPVAAAPAPQKIVSGDQMFRDSQGIAQLGSRWQEGKQMVDKGQAMQRQAQTDMEQAQKLINEGQRVMQESEDGYKNLKQ